MIGRGGRIGEARLEAVDGRDERVEQGLVTEVGVTALRPDGDRFDPAVHEAGGTLPTDDPALDGVIAETEVPGFADRGTLLRAPIVTVMDGASHTLGFLGGAFGAPVVPLGTDSFGQSGTIADLYGYMGIDTRHIVEAALLATELPSG